ncbi:MAG: RNA pseudouridine synthase [Treponema sp.]|jgi:23S rRNA pseudouridine1911/1915/1917 synthase|nr:RNA pseudouridine synthase [Treponema sp.]
MDAPGPESPRLITETGDFAVVYKPPRLHSVPLRPGEGGTLLEWYGKIFPPVTDLRGKKPLEGGILHRLDYETQGLVLFGKTQAALDSLRAQQEEGRFVKEYGALTVEETSPPPPGFPPPPEPPSSLPCRIASYFRPYGPGRKAVRPATAYMAGREIAADRGRPYETEIVEMTALGEGRRYFTLRISRGFRHQIRCHLAWLGNPIAGDPLYGNKDAFPPEGFLALRAQALYFFDPRDGRPREFRIPSVREEWARYF